MDTGSDGVVRRSTQVLFQLCGEVLLESLPSRQPSIVRSGAAVGLELLDLLLSPHHVLRITEELTLRNTWVLGRRVQLDISLDRLSRQAEEGAMQLSTLISGRTDGEDDPAADRELLWLPLDTVPRPVSVSVSVTGNDGSPLPRPPQREVRLTLEAALYHILRESLRAHPDFEVDGTPVNVMMRHDDASRWLLQSALLAVCEHGPGSARSTERQHELRRRLPGVVIEQASSRDDVFTLLDKLARDETAGPSHRTALAVLRDALAGDQALLDLLDLVHRDYFVVAGVDRRLRDQSLQFELPASEALDSSVIKRIDRRSRRMLDPREHNYTVHMWVPLPENVRQYNLHVRTLPGHPQDAYSEVSLIAAIRYDDHPGRTAIDALSTCADELTRTFEEAAKTGDAQSAGRDLSTGALSVGFIESRAVAALDRLASLVDLQDRAADELSARWAQASTWTVRQTISQLRKVTTEARNQLRAARERLLTTSSCTEAYRMVPTPGNGGRPDADPDCSGLEAHAQETTAALEAAARSVDHPLLGMQLISSELPGEEVARIRIGRSMLASRERPQPRFLEVWATVSDEARPYALSALGPPLILALMMYVVGALLFDTLTWPVRTTDTLGRAVAAGTADAVVAVLLLVPAFALTQFRLPGRWSVPGRLRMPARVFVLGAVAALGAAATVVATQVGRTNGHPHLVVWTFRVALVGFLLWAVWERVASSLHVHYAWRPKGLKPVFGGDDLEPATTRPGRGPRSWLGRLRRGVAYDSKAPDAEFDLTLPTRSFPSLKGGS